MGAPSRPLEGLRNTAYFKYIYENHQGHHVLGGQCNYNARAARHEKGGPATGAASAARPAAPSTAQRALHRPAWARAAQEAVA